MVGFQGESPADRRALEGAVANAGSVASRSYREFRDSRDVQAMFKRERARAKRVVLNCPGLDIAHRRLVQSERRYGAEPRLHDILARHFHVTKNNFYPCIKTLIRFTHL